jgi:hypothetical protein
MFKHPHRVLIYRQDKGQYIIVQTSYSSSSSKQVFNFSSSISMRYRRAREHRLRTSSCRQFKLAQAVFPIESYVLLNSRVRCLDEKMLWRIRWKYLLTRMLAAWRASSLHHLERDFREWQWRVRFCTELERLRLHLSRYSMIFFNSIPISVILNFHSARQSSVLPGTQKAHRTLRFHQSQKLRRMNPRYHCYPYQEGSPRNCGNTI